MTNEISKIKIGTTMSELKILTKNSNLNDAAKTSIFNFIKDEEDFDDGMISNTVELNIIKSFFSGKNNTKSVPQVEMPDNLQADEAQDVEINESYQENIGVFDKKTEEFLGYKSKEEALLADEKEESISQHDKSVSITAGIASKEKEVDKIHTKTISKNNGENVYSTTQRKFTSIRDGSDVYIQDTLIDWENDGIADQRNLRIDTANDGVNPVEYRDSDLDGQADVKTVYTEQGDVYYERDENGKWVIKDA